MKVNRTYSKLLQSYKHKYEIYYGGAASGKSHFIAQKIILKCLSGKRKVLVLRKTQVTLRDSVIALFLSILDKENIPYIYRSSFREIQIGSSFILFKGIDDPERIKSITDITDIWLEEATEFYPEDFTQLVLRLRVSEENLQYFISFNPISKVNWVYRYFFDPTDPEYFLKDKTYLKLRTTYEDNISNLNVEYIKDLQSLRTSNPTYYSIYALGEWGTLDKLVFPLDSYIISTYQPSANAKHIFGLDPGFSDATGFTHAIVDGDVLYLKEEFYATELITTQIASEIKRMGYQNRLIICDCAAALTIAELQKLGLYNVRPCTKTPGSVLEGINQIKAYKLIIDPSCTYFIRDIRNYCWEKDKKSGLYIDTPARGVGEEHQNLIDALRYSLQALGTDVRVLKIKLPKGI